MESHGGYLCRFEDVDVLWLQQLAREAIEADGHLADDCALLVTVLPGAKVVRLAFDGAHTYGRAGARWYLNHHALARRLSSHLRVAVHAYVFDPDELEQVVTKLSIQKCLLENALDTETCDAVMLVAPNNPTGVEFSTSLLERIAVRCAEMTPA